MDCFYKFRYGGPGSQLVDQEFKIDWGTFLSSNMSYIYGMIDGRGSGFQGEKRKFELYKNFGTVEVKDQIDVTKYVIFLLLGHCLLLLSLLDNFCHYDIVRDY